MYMWVDKFLKEDTSRQREKIEEYSWAHMTGGSATERPRLPYATQRNPFQAKQKGKVIQKVPRDSIF